MEMESIQRLTKDLKAAAVKLTDHEARFLVDYYYIVTNGKFTKWALANNYMFTGDKK